VIAGSHNIDAKVEKFVGKRWRDAKTSSRVLAIGNYKVDGVLLYQSRQAVLDDGPPRAAKNVTDEENVQKAGLRCSAAGLWNGKSGAES
jgi:hypothetical protein